MQKNKGAILRSAVIIIIVLAILIYFNIASLPQVREVFINIGMGLYGVAKVAWEQLTLPILKFFGDLLQRLTPR